MPFKVTSLPCRAHSGQHLKSAPGLVQRPVPIPAFALVRALAPARRLSRSPSRGSLVCASPLVAAHRAPARPLAAHLKFMPGLAFWQHFVPVPPHHTTKCTARTTTQGSTTLHAWCTTCSLRTLGSVQVQTLSEPEPDLKSGSFGFRFRFAEICKLDPKSGSGFGEIYPEPN